MPALNCWRCDRKLADVRQPGGDVVITCPRCHAQNRVTGAVTG